MPFDLPLLQPVAFRRAIKELNPPQKTMLYDRFRRVPVDTWKVQWDIYTNTRKVAKPNVPNSEAHVVSLGERTAGSSSWIYLRTKMGFRPTTTRMLRAIGDRRIDRRQGEDAVLRDVAQIRITFDNFAEMCWWSAMSGHLNAEFRDNVWSVDYLFPESHQPSVSVSWDSATPAQIIHDLTTWKNLIKRDSQTTPTEIFATENTMNLVFKAFARATNEDGTPSNIGQTYLTDRMREEYYNSGGSIGNFLGFRWTMVDATYQQESGTFTDYVPDGALYMGSYDGPDTMETWEGPSFDFSAPQGFTGHFAKNWEEGDPSQLWFMLEYSFFPVIYTPQKMLFVSSVAPDIYSGIARIK